MKTAKWVLDKKCRLERYLSNFVDFRGAFSMAQPKFSKRSAVLLGYFSKWRGDDKSKYVEHFLPAKWASLSNNEKIHAHSK